MEVGADVSRSSIHDDGKSSYRCEVVGPKHGGCPEVAVAATKAPVLVLVSRTDDRKQVSEVVFYKSVVPAIAVT